MNDMNRKVVASIGAVVAATALTSCGAPPSGSDDNSSSSSSSTATEHLVWTVLESKELRDMYRACDDKYGTLIYTGTDGRMSVVPGGCAKATETPVIQ